MGWGSWCRRNGFWICDKIFQHGAVRKSYLETKAAYQRGTDVDETEKKLRQLLQHASSTTRFYEKYKNANLNEFPIVNKIDYQTNWESFVSQNYVNDSKCHKECTSGSTGTPLEILYDQGKTRKRYGTSIFINSLAGYYIGDRQLFLRVWVDRIKQSAIKQKVKNLVPFDTSIMDKGSLNTLCELIARKHIEAIAGYASSLTTLCLFIRDNQIDCSRFKVKSITPISETLSPYIKKELEKQFSCTVNSIYGAEEFGSIGIQPKESEEYYIDTSGVFIEVLKMDKDIPAEDGELGRLVITDLYNYAFPIIRYENGDTVVCKTVKVSENRYSKYFTQIYGRKTDLIYGTDGEPRSPHLITNKMWGIEDIIQWKFIQTGQKQYRFVINGDKDKIDEKHISDLIKEELGNDAEFSFEYVKEIPVLRSGKRKYIENLYKENMQ